ncbi:4'-phosphopantetheinyl transferase family protein [Paenibacillus apiarius]|uniref:4'-phosphopantetheinyl transferase superfamily protein n=1 Tax=Paenibacillus apiarius TaxID=46240 RepID=A0ABT4DNS2_9BACL|nr:4'-phosphopantetheinyl transferase superfamily protein [Paenibacillus apiarius]MBN3525305.1 4'-phosphopantetheinyl transferase superfamily protein [Paenibacillus apiarius]MCY9512848.1 4'-phosphopantetheinyl transferase superfamily protein [Paenibacillus apiarius]MCY9519008.1 4'-phosphopantetheinyl transferase superfamily protein [Paenibacillus apiarius]MCY9550817.1 4'-phosphopantetheinyl transferase superfamily protein [Paenibacillus apiarius]MCY9559749.1 4'-phosphopantetheinyl transferase 
MNIVLLKLEGGSPRDEMDRLIDRLIPYITPEKYKRLDRLRKHKERQRLVAADIIVRSLLCRKLGQRNDELVFRTNRYGKPYLKGNPVYFNVSHSGDIVAAALDDAPVGIDIERLREWDMDVARLICAPREWDMLLCADGDRARQEQFFTIWTAKKSCLKAIGTGFGMSPSLLEIVTETAAEPNGCNPVWSVDDYYVKQYSGLEAGYCMAVCARHSEFAEQVEYITLEQLAHRFMNYR